MSLGSSKFWFGMLLGSVAGAMAYRCCKTEKAKEWKEKMCAKMRQMRDKAEDTFEEGKKKVADAGSRIAETVADKADEARNKAHSFANNNNK